MTDMSIMFSSEEATFFKLASGVGTPRLARVAALMIRITSRSRVFCHLRSAELVGFAGPGHLSGKCQAPRKAGNGATAPTCLWTLSEKSTGVPVAGGFRIVDSPSAPGRAISLACKGSDDREASMPGAYRVMGVDDTSYPYPMPRGESSVSTGR